jgi:hypothetical protein
VQNSYPPAPLAAQGNTVYSYSQASQAYSISPQELFRQASDFTRASVQSSQLAINGYNQLAQQQLLLQSRLSEPLIRSAAATNLLRAAGLDQSVPTQRQQLSLRIYADSSGNWQVEPQQSDNSPVQADYSKPQSDQQSIKGSPVQAPDSRSVPQTSSIIATKCYKCHSAQSTALKGKLYLDRNISSEILRESILRLKSNDEKVRMPPPSEGNLTPGEMAQVLDELLELSAPITQLPADDVVPPAPQTLQPQQN